MLDVFENFKVDVTRLQLFLHFDDEIIISNRPLSL